MFLGSPPSFALRTRPWRSDTRSSRTPACASLGCSSLFQVSCASEEPATFVYDQDHPTPWSAFHMPAACPAPYLPPTRAEAEGGIGARPSTNGKQHAAARHRSRKGGSVSGRLCSMPQQPTFALSSSFVRGSPIMVAIMVLFVRCFNLTAAFEVSARVFARVRVCLPTPLY